VCARVCKRHFSGHFKAQKLLIIYLFSLSLSLSLHLALKLLGGRDFEEEESAAVVFWQIMNYSWASRFVEVWEAN
jgi:hypothetical protein